MEQNRQFQRMLWLSVLLHIFLVGSILLISFFRPEVTLAPSSEEAQFVELYEISEMPEMIQSIEKLREKGLITFQTISSLIPEPTPMPKPTVRPTSTQKPPTPKPTSTPPKRLTPIPRYRSTPTPHRIRPPKKRIVPFEVPKRPAVLRSRTPLQRKTPSPVSLQTPIPGEGKADSERQLFLGAQSSEGPSVMLDQEDAFPFPEYLQSVKVKIEGLWIPQGSGTLSIYLIIDKNGKILKSGVDKGGGVGVEKLRESIIRTLTLIKRFDSLPQEYDGMMLRIRIIVRR